MRFSENIQSYPEGGAGSLRLHPLLAVTAIKVTLHAQQHLAEQTESQASRNPRPFLSFASFLTRRSSTASCRARGGGLRV